MPSQAGTGHPLLAAMPGEAVPLGFFKSLFWTQMENCEHFNLAFVLDSGSPQPGLNVLLY